MEITLTPPEARWLHATLVTAINQALDHDDLTGASIGDDILEHIDLDIIYESETV